MQKSPRAHGVFCIARNGQVSATISLLKGKPLRAYRYSQRAQVLLHCPQQKSSRVRQPPERRTEIQSPSARREFAHYSALSTRQTRMPATILQSSQNI
eukprot:7173537-Pyramimonas_sp.AAC.1